MGVVFTRVTVGRARVVREVRAAGPLMTALRAPVPAREPWLTAAVNADAARRRWSRPVAVVVEPDLHGRPDALALLAPRGAPSGPAARPVAGGRGPARRGHRRTPRRDPGPVDAAAVRVAAR